MSLGWITLGWVGVSLWLVTVNVMTKRIAAGELDQLRRGGPLWVTLVDAALITLFGALWFASLGTGAWWLVFGLLGLVADLPLRLRTAVQSRKSKVERGEIAVQGQSMDSRLSTFDLARGTVLSIVRFVGSGFILSLVR